MHLKRMDEGSSEDMHKNLKILLQATCSVFSSQLVVNTHQELDYKTRNNLEISPLAHYTIIWVFFPSFILLWNQGHPSATPPLPLN